MSLHKTATIRATAGNVIFFIARAVRKMRFQKPIPHKQTTCNNDTTDVFDLLHQAEQYGQAGLFDRAADIIESIIACVQQNCTCIQRPISTTLKAHILNELAMAYQQSKKFQHAWATYQQVFAIIEDIPTPTQDKCKRLFFTLNNFATLLRNIGQLDKAFQILRGLIETQPYIIPIQDPRLADIHGNMGIVLEEIGRLSSANNAFHNAYYIRKTTQHHNHRAIVQNLLDIIRVQDKQECTYQALFVCRVAIREIIDSHQLMSFPIFTYLISKQTRLLNRFAILTNN